MTFVRWVVYILLALIFISVLPVILLVIIIVGLVLFPIASVLLMIIIVCYIGYFGISYVSSLLVNFTHSPPQSINKTSSSSSISDANTSSHAQSINQESPSSSISDVNTSSHAQFTDKGKQKEIPFQDPGSSSSIPPSNIIAYDQQIDLDNIDLKRTYTFEEFEYINNQLKNRTLEINGEPINLFELNENGKLIPMPQATINMEAVVSEIVGQLRSWNVFTRQGGVVTASQGGFKFGTEESENEIRTQAGKKIRAPDVSFTPKDTYRNLTQQQLWTFQGEPFTPIFVVDVGNIGTDTTNSAFMKADDRFKNEYFEDGTSVQLGWLIDPRNKRILIYKKGVNRSSLRTWRDISGENILPGFTLDISLIDDCISQEESETSDTDSSDFDCPKCGASFNSNYEFVKHFEKVHARKRRRTQEPQE